MTVSGKIVDVEVKSKYCKSCEHCKNKVRTIENEWQETHADHCQATHEGSSRKMEVDGVMEMFACSECLYTESNTPITSAMETAKHLRASLTVIHMKILKRKKKVHRPCPEKDGHTVEKPKKKTKGGKGKQNIWATFHKLSTDNPQHDNCSESWCEWKEAKAVGSLDTFHHKPSLLKDVYAAIKPIYEELSRDELLNRCLGGYTQNSNENFNATVWNLAPKSYSSGKTVLDIAVNIAVCNFNEGLTSILWIMKVLDVLAVLQFLPGNLR
ncbi:uncharacterized protein LOC108915512 [Anoplophora glabripennis]|uniref:uncharacterized protein LOC108915512 n=1 Tax=Anoplophora glabripennis TaxID=217634 RepID=UPI000874A547|nr:uncharacterized protein LOC108915512 [Anoplophora glabripennis]